MTTALDKVLRRSLKIKDREYLVTLSPNGLKLTLKGRRLGLDLKWSELVNGEAALAAALQASVGQFEDAPHPFRKKKKRVRRVT